MIAPTKLKEFLSSVALNPKNFISTGKVITPTIIRVVKNTASTFKDTPASLSMAASGNAMNPGIRATEPIKEAVAIAPMPDPWPR